ncbi:hypothetical protein ATCC51561_963 [Campylobacter concisus ATCC 51561]|nr:hypothetical protein ATCC51561_963 [Campylobacter concisus ATCC 51561]
MENLKHNFLSFLSFINLNLQTKIRSADYYKTAQGAATLNVQWGRWGFGGGRGDVLRRKLATASRP